MTRRNLFEDREDIEDIDCNLRDMTKICVEAATVLTHLFSKHDGNDLFTLPGDREDIELLAKVYELLKNVDLRMPNVSVWAVIKIYHHAELNNHEDWVAESKKIGCDCINLVGDCKCNGICACHYASWSPAGWCGFLTKKQATSFRSPIDRHYRRPHSKVNNRWVVAKYPIRIIDIINPDLTAAEYVASLGSAS